MKILILTAATGGGHLRASSALKSYILETQEDCEVEIVDTLKYISPLLDKTVTEGYEAMAKRTPKLFGSLYKSKMCIRDRSGSTDSPRNPPKISHRG